MQKINDNFSIGLSKNLQIFLFHPKACDNTSLVSNCNLERIYFYENFLGFYPVTTAHGECEGICLLISTSWNPI